MSVVPVSSGNTARHILLLQDVRPAGCAATPSFALHIAETMHEQGGDPRGLGLRYGLYGAEPWTEGLRGALERAFGCPAYDVYGLSEIVGPGVAGECEAREGLHLADDHFLPEIIDPATGAVLAPGHEGELVLTTLTKRALPLIRYRTGDVTTLTDAACACGRTSARIARVKGRSDDMLIVKGVNLYPSEVEAALLGVEELVPHYQLLVDRRTTLARLEVQVEPAPAVVERCGGFDAAHPVLVDLRRRIGERLAKAIGLSVEVTLVAPRTLPRSEGKAVRVVEKRKTGRQEAGYERRAPDDGQDRAGRAPGVRGRDDARLPRPPRAPHDHAGRLRAGRRVRLRVVDPEGPERRGKARRRPDREGGAAPRGGHVRPAGGP